MLALMRTPTTSKMPLSGHGFGRSASDAPRDALASPFGSPGSAPSQAAGRAAASPAGDLRVASYAPWAGGQGASRAGTPGLTSRVDRASAPAPASPAPAPVRPAAPLPACPPSPAGCDGDMLDDLIGAVTWDVLFSSTPAHAAAAPAAPPAAPPARPASPHAGAVTVPYTSLLDELIGATTWDALFGATPEKRERAAAAAIVTSPVKTAPTPAAAPPAASAAAAQAPAHVDCIRDVIDNDAAEEWAEEWEALCCAEAEAACALLDDADLDALFDEVRGRPHQACAALARPRRACCARPAPLMPQRVPRQRTAPQMFEPLPASPVPAPIELNLSTLLAVSQGDQAPALRAAAAPAAPAVRAALPALLAVVVVVEATGRAGPIATGPTRAPGPAAPAAPISSRTRSKARAVAPVAARTRSKASARPTAKTACAA
jgi:hypothetical protein